MLSSIRQAIRTERIVNITYTDVKNDVTTRTIWPFALGYFEHVLLIVAWCELRHTFRSFRADRISALSISDQRYPRRRQALLKAWREIEHIPPQ